VTALRAVAGGGRLATITGDPPPTERGITVSDVYVRADGARLAALVAVLAEGLVSLHVAATLPLAEAATALEGAVTGLAGGATVLTIEQSPEQPPSPRSGPA
jgi:hypothetical protein